MILRTLALTTLALALTQAAATPARALEPVPDKLVVLTFDDGVKSHFTEVRPILLRYKFGATFFITEGFDFTTNKKDYMSWDEIAQLDKDGFEIGNHTRDHLRITPATAGRIGEQLEAIEKMCRDHGIAKPISFAWPGNGFAAEAFAAMREHGIRFARRGGAPEYPYEQGRGFAYEPGLDHPLLVPSAGDARPDWKLDDFVRAVEQARFGRIAVLQFHGVPDGAHPWVNTPVERFETYMKYLADHGYQVIAMRDLARYVDPQVAPRNPLGVIEDRQRLLAEKASGVNFRRPKGDAELRYWLENMVVYHGYTPVEVSAATGMSVAEVTAALERFGFHLPWRAKREADAPLLVLPYPGGRHPRIGFRDGAIRPQRDTKVSVFAPWDDGGYVVVDVPEAIWWKEGDERELLYLAHTHVPTRWSKQGVALAPLEWERHEDGTLSFERRLPNGVTFGSRVEPQREMVRMEMWITNGTDETLKGLRVQNCVMLKEATGFAAAGKESDVVVLPPYAARRAADRDRWIITAWEPFQRGWANPDCPCLHSDPQYADCGPGRTQRLQGRLWFYEGKDVRAEIARVDKTTWRDSEKAEK